MDITKIKVEDINLKNIKAIAQGVPNNLLNKVGLLDDDLVKMIKHRQEQCPDCVAAGSCIECGCSINAMMSAPIKSCPKGKWSSYVTNNTHTVDLSKLDTFTFNVKVADNTQVDNISLSCGCMQILSHNITNNILSLTIKFNADSFTIKSFKAMDIELTSVNELSNLDKYIHFTFQRIK
jgi:hypothetical protein